MKGQCLCGSVKVSAPDSVHVSVCHCSTCRRWSGGPMFAIHCRPGVEITGQGVVTYRSSEWAERGFCSQCGTHLFYRLVQTDEHFLPAGLFQDPSLLLDREIFIDEKPDFYDLGGERERLTGRQVVEKYGG